MRTIMYPFIMLTGISILLGIIILIKFLNLTVLIPEYFFNWPMVFIIIGSCLMLKNKVDQFGLIVVGFGFAAFLPGDYIAKLNFYKIFFSSLLIITGMVMLKPAPKTNIRKKMDLNNLNDNQIILNNINTLNF